MDVNDNDESEFSESDEKDDLVFHKHAFSTSGYLFQ